MMMRLTLIALTTLLSIGSALAQTTPSEKPILPKSAYDDEAMPNTRTTYPNAFSIEVLGKGIGFSVNYDRTFARQLTAGIGLGSAGLEGQNRSATLANAYVQGYLLDSGSSPYAVAGMNVTMNTSTAKNQVTSLGNMELGGSGVAPFVGLGYELRSDNGALFRIAGYGIVAKTFSAWAGLSLGWAF